MSKDLYPLLKLKYPISAIKRDVKYGYVFMVSALEDMPVVSSSVHKTDQMLSDLEYIMLFYKAHEAQIDKDVRDFIKREAEEGYPVDDLLIKKYLS